MTQVAPQSWPELRSFVDASFESETLEYKPLFLIGRCGRPACTYCNLQSLPHSRGRTGAELAKAVVGLANREGGLLIIGVKQVDRDPPRHRIETTHCQNRDYSQEQIAEAIRLNSVPPVPIQVRSLSNRGQRAFVVRVPSSLRLHAFLDQERNCHRLLVRGAAETVDMTVDQIEFSVRTKENVSANSVFRARVEYELSELLNCLLDVRGGGRDPVETIGLLSEESLGELALSTGDYRQFSESVLTLLMASAGKMAGYHTPNQLVRLVSTLSDAPSFLPAGNLDWVEAGLVVMCRNMRPMTERENSLDPLHHIGFMADRLPEELASRFLTYERSFGDLYAEEKRLRPHRLLDEETLRQAFGDFTNTLFELYPHIWETLSLYRGIHERYGDKAFRMRLELGQGEERS